MLNSTHNSASFKSNVPLLELRNLSTHYVSASGTRVVRAVEDVSLTLNARETLGIVGESGSGKSTLALTLLRVLPPAARIVSGQMLLDGEDLAAKSEEEMRQVRGKRIGRLAEGLADAVAPQQQQRFVPGNADPERPVAVAPAKPGHEPDRQPVDTGLGGHGDGPAPAPKQPLDKIWNRNLRGEAQALHQRCVLEIAVGQRCGDPTTHWWP